MKNKKLWSNIIGWGLCAVVIASLLFVIIKDRKATDEQEQEIEEHIASLEDEWRRESENYEARKGIVDSLIYGMEFDNFVLWGEDDWDGERNFSLSGLIQSSASWIIRDKMVNEFGEEFIGWDVTTPTPTVFDRSVINEGMTEILARAGVNPIAVTESFEIPSELLPVNISLGVSGTDEELRFAKQRDIRLGDTTIAGVEGTLTSGEGEYDEDHPRLAFIRKKEGRPAEISEGETIEIQSATYFMGLIPIMFFNNTSDIQNNGEEAENFVSDLERLVDRYAVEGVYYEEESGEYTEESGEYSTEASSEYSTEASAEYSTEEGGEYSEESSDNRRYVVVCLAEEGSALDIILNDRFGDHYIRTDISKDKITEEGYTDLAAQITDRLNNQGCFEKAIWAIDYAAEQFRNY